MADDPIKPAKRGGGAPTGQYQFPRHVNLPPAGFQRNEELLRRTDTLTQAAEERAAALDANAINPHALAPDREILAEYDGFEVTDRQPGFRYKWVPYDNPISNKGLFVNQAMTQGWQVVCGDMPEAKAHEIVGGMRKIGDTVLMRIPEEKGKLLDERERHLAALRTGSAHTALMELGRKRGVIVKPIGEANPSLLRQMDTRDRAALAAGQKYEQGLRDGTLKI